MHICPSNAFSGMLWDQVHSIEPHLSPSARTRKLSGKNKQKRDHQMPKNVPNYTGGAYSAPQSTLLD